MERLPERAIPSDQDAEHLVISCILQDPATCFQICAEMGLVESSFYFPAGQTMFRVLWELWSENEPIILKTLMHTIERAGVTVGGKLGEHQLTGNAFIANLYHHSPGPAFLGKFIDIVLECANRRAVIHASAKANALAMDMQNEIGHVLSSVEEMLLDVGKIREGKKIHTRDMNELVMRAMGRLDHRLNGEWKVEMPTGIRALDRATMGFKAPTVTMVLGTPSDGKSSLLVNIAEHLAMHCGKRVGIISMDDSDDQLTDRLIQSRARVNRWEIEQTGKITPGDFEAIREAATELGHAKDRIFIRDDGGLTPREITATFAAWKSKYGLDIGIIDHIQLAKSDENTGDRFADAESVSRALKPMAKRLDIPLLVASQVTKKGIGENQSYSTKNTTALGEDANNVWTIKREPDSTDAWIHISKQKDGPRNVTVPVKYIKEWTRFADRDSEPIAERPELVAMGPGKKNRKGA